MARRIGILGGISAESTLEYYSRLIKMYLERKGDAYYPEIVIFSLNFQRFTDLENCGSREDYIAEIMRGIDALQAAQADFIIMAANSPHAVFGEIETRASVPMLSIVEVVAESAKRQGMKVLLLLGIKFTMQSSFYRDACHRRDISVLVPSEEEQDEIDQIIFEELTKGTFRAETRQRLLEIISRYSVDGVILGCTELPLILSQEDTPVRLLDSLDLHTRAALEYALDQNDLASVDTCCG
jgi:aspartate racemase